MSIEAGHILAFLIGGAAGLMLGIKLGTASAKTSNEKYKPKKKEVVVPDDETSRAMESARMEVYDCHISHVDVQRRMIIPLASHLHDVVDEAEEEGRIVHRMRLVFLGLGDGPLEFESNKDLLLHCAKIHETCPHVPLWLDSSTLETYLRLAFMGLQINPEVDPKERITSWSQFRSDIVHRCNEILKKELSNPTDELIHNLITEGMERVDEVIGRIDPSQRTASAY